MAQSIKRLQRLFIFLLINLGLAVAFACRPFINSKENLSRTQSILVPDGYKLGIIFDHQKPVEVVYREENGYARVGDDVLIPLSQVFNKNNLPAKLAADTRFAKWPNGRVPYTLPPNFTFQAEFTASVAEWAKAGTSWEPALPSDTTFVTIKQELLSGICGEATLGMQTDSFIRLQSEPLSSGCQALSKLFIMMHEMAHVLGFQHEFHRMDRDAFLKGIPDIPKYAKFNLLNLGAFDFDSITMYPSASIPGMTKIDGQIIEIPKNISFADLDRTSAYYFGENQCDISGAGGNALFTGTSSKYGCTSKCNDLALTAPSRNCAFNNQTFIGAKRCTITSGSGAVLHASDISKKQCKIKCTKTTATSTDGACLWVGTVFAGQSKCSIKQPNGTIVFQSKVPKYRCLEECRRSSSTHPGGECLWKGKKIKLSL